MIKMKNKTNLKVGDIVCFFEGKDSRNISHDEDGRVILCIHHIPLGYAKIKKIISVRERVVLVKAEHTVKDI